jgi:hypothetical protein
MIIKRFPCIIMTCFCFLDYCVKSVSSLWLSFLPSDSLALSKKKKFVSKGRDSRGVFRLQKCVTQCVHNLPQTSILLGKLIATKEPKKFGCAAGPPAAAHPKRWWGQGVPQTTSGGVVCISTEASNKDPFEKVTTNKDPFEKRPQPAFRSSQALVLVRGLCFNGDG